MLDGKKINHSTYKRKIFNPILEELGIGFHTPHECRHFCISKLRKIEGVSETLVKRIVGHITYTGRRYN